MIFNAVLAMGFVLGMAGLAVRAGYKITHSENRPWLRWFAASFCIVIAVILLHRIPWLGYHPLFRWLSKGVIEYVAMVLCLPFCFAILIPRLSIRRQQYVVGIFAGLGILYFIVPPFIDPILLHGDMEDGKTWIENGVCLQTTDYTCGAAAAVTALKQHGIDADEKDLALASHTSRARGAVEYKLARAIASLYGHKGIVCQVNRFKRVSDLKDRCPVIVIVKYKPMIDHYITVLEVESDTVLVGDPLRGRERLTHEAFSAKWRKAGIVVAKKNAGL